jgi:hypothetical protein
MKKIFILSILIMPVMANADNVGPSAASGTPVIATANAPYAIVDTVNGDTNHVVTASYVKEAYNDTIAAVNKVNADKQDKLKNGSNNHNIESKVVAGSNITDYVKQMLPNSQSDADYNYNALQIVQELGVQNLDDALISARVVLDGLHAMGQNKQQKLENYNSGKEMYSDVISVDNLNSVSFINNYNTFRGNMDILADNDLDDYMMSADSVITLVKTAVDEVQNVNDSKRISAVTTWGNDTPTKLTLTNQ